MSETEQMYSAKEVATALGVGAAMLRRYAATYERLTGSEVEIHKRDGRLFTQSQLDTLLAARAVVQRQDMSVDAALETVLRSPEMALAARAGAGASVDTLALTEALRASVTEPLLSELSSIKAEMAALRSEMRDRGSAASTRPVVFGAEEWATEPVEAPGATQASRGDADGPIVRVARWLERRVRGGRG